MITVIGSINLDLTATVARLPRPGETVPGEGFATAPGGKGANQALAARRAGAEVRMVGAVGRDGFAEAALALLAADGVDLAAVRRTRAPTGTAMILVDGAGENMIAVVPGANAALTPGDVAAAGIGASDHVLLQQEVPHRVVEAALWQARAAGAVSLLNAAPFHDGWADLLPLADMLVVNESEFARAAAALGLPDGGLEPRMRALAAKTDGTVVVTLGAAGAAAATADRMLSVAAPAVTPVDTVGAGDTFCGYLAAGLADGLRLEAALRRAAAAGALACLRAGAQPAIPLAAAVDEVRAAAG